jgi:hypothetical protein
MNTPIPGNPKLIAAVVAERAVIPFANLHLVATWCFALAVAACDYRSASFANDFPDLPAIFAAIWSFGCALQVFVTIMALIKARGWDYIGIFMLYGFWLCAFLLPQLGILLEAGTMHGWKGS